MPRARQTQPISAPTGMAYGQHQALEQSQAAVPLPQQAPVPAPSAGVAPPPAQTGHEQALAAASAMPSIPGLMTGPTQRPSEPVTTGLSNGMGAGPEALGQSPTVQAAFRALADQTQDPDIAYLADIVGQLGL